MVFPAYAGVFLLALLRLCIHSGLPRIRGGVSRARFCACRQAASSPHTRGCFHQTAGKGRKGIVFPAYAGVFLTRRALMRFSSGLPRIRGGVSLLSARARACSWSSPHTRGCFCSCSRLRCQMKVFPAYAGVFPMLFSKNEKADRAFDRLFL